MKEKLKSLLLILLFISSLYFIKILWFEGPSSFFPVSEERTDQSKYLSEVIKPDSYLLKLSPSESYILYDRSSYKIWEEGKLILETIFRGKNLKVNKINYKDYKKNRLSRGLVYYFPYEINFYLLMETLNLDKNKELISRIPKIDKMFIPLEREKGIDIVFGLGKNYYLVDAGKNIDLSGLILEIEKIPRSNNDGRDYLVGKAHNLGRDLYVPDEKGYQASYIYLDNIFLSLGEREKNALAEKFLGKNIDYVREIVEDNASNIYIYNKTIFKINNNGIIEYFNPLNERILERNLLLSLSTGIEFMEKVGALEDGIYLYSIEEIERDGNLGYKLGFKNKLAGLELEINNSLVDEYISIEVFNSKIRSFTKYGRKIGFIEEGEVPPILSALNLIEKNKIYIVEAIKECQKEEKIGLNIWKYIDTMKLAYYDQGLFNRSEKLSLVWLLDMKGKRMIFDAYSGDLIDIKKISR